MRAQKRTGTIGLAVTVVVVLAIVLNPTTVDSGRQHTVTQILGFLHSLGLPNSFQYAHLEFTANVIMYLPLGFFAGLIALPNKWWTAVLGLPMFSAGCEATQLLFLPDRFATVSDIAANSLGALVGIGGAYLIIRARSNYRGTTNSTIPPNPKKP